MESDSFTDMLLPKSQEALTLTDSMVSEMIGAGPHHHRETSTPEIQTDVI
jgi:hypothetical protein